MCDAVLRKYVCVGLYTISKQICNSCETCQQINRKTMRKQSLARREPGLRPFQSIQVDFTDLPKVGRFKYLLGSLVGLGGSLPLNVSNHRCSDKDSFGANSP